MTVEDKSQRRQSQGRGLASPEGLSFSMDGFGLLFGSEGLLDYFVCFDKHFPMQRK